MSLNNKIKQQGFTIVELLIVIVVIGILAAITIVAYNGVQNRAKTTTAQSTANNVDKKAELYNTEESRYPLTSSELTTAAATKSYQLVGAVFGTPASTADPATLLFRKCGSGTPTTQSAITATTITGVRIVYFDYTANAQAYVTAGVDSGGTVACPTAA